MIYPHFWWLLRHQPEMCYPLVNVNKQLWKDPPFFMGKLTNSMAIFNSFLSIYQRVNLWSWLVVWIIFSPPARWGLLDFMSVASSSCRLLPRPASCLLLVLLVVLVVLVVLVQLRPAIHSVRCRTQPRPSTPSVPCRTSTTTSHAQCSLPDLNHDQPRPVFPAGPHLRVSMPSVPCRTSTAGIHAKCSLPDLM